MPIVYCIDGTQESIIDIHEKLSVMNERSIVLKRAIYSIDEGKARLIPILVGVENLRNQYLAELNQLREQERA